MKLRYDLSVTPPLDVDGLAAACAEILAELDGLPDACSVSLSFVTDDEIRELNKTYRGLDEPTDVLSFPLWEEDGRFVPEQGWAELPLGDVVISSEFVRRGAEAEGRDHMRELVLAAAHGTLHLVGFDHTDDDERDVMWATQDRIVELAMK